MRGKVAAHLEPDKQQESRKIDARLQAQIEMQRQELAESRRVLLDETCAYNRERAFSEARTAALERRSQTSKALFALVLKTTTESGESGNSKKTSYGVRTPHCRCVGPIITFNLNAPTSRDKSHT